MENFTMSTTKVMEDLKANDTGRENITEGMGIKNPLLINLVVSSVFKNLDVEDLKNCRLVNEIWKSESTPILKNKSVVRFKYGLNERKIKFKMCSKYLKEMIHFVHPNFDFSDCFHVGAGMEVRNFFRCLGNQIKSLRLTMNVENPSYLKTFKEISENIPNLENLEMVLIFVYGRRDEFDQGYRSAFLNIKSLDKVKKLTLINTKINTNLYGGSDIIATPTEMAEFIVKLVPKPESLVLNTCSWLNDEIFEKYTNSHDVQKVTISDITMYIGNNHHEVLSKWPVPLKKLKLNFGLHHHQDLKDFQTLLNRHCPTLEELKIVLYFTKSIQITTPKFPKLHKLKMTNGNNGAGKIDFQFDLDLKDHFPLLQMEKDQIVKMFAELRA